MTVPSDPRKSGPYAGDGSNLDFDFDFKVFAKTDIAVSFFDNDTQAESLLLLDIDYSVTLNADQDTTPGGTISLIGDFTSDPPSADDRLAIAGALAYAQPTDITNEDGFLAQVIEDALDRLLMLIQQLDEKVGRAVIQPITDTSGSPEALILQIQAMAAEVAEIYDNFDDRYLGPKASDPTLDNDGNTLLAGALYFNTGLGQMRVYTGAAWQAVTGGAVKRELQTAGVGGQSVFNLTTMTYIPGVNNLEIYAGGIRQQSGYTETDSDTVTFSPAIAEGVEVLFQTVNNSTGAVSAANVGVAGFGPFATGNLQDILVAMLDQVVYRVGSKFESYSDDRNPNIILGFGTWVAVEAVVIVGYKSGDTEFGTAGGTGGSKTRTLNANEIPLKIAGIGSLVAGSVIGPINRIDAQAATPFSILPPYEVWYVWRRTA